MSKGTFFARIFADILQCEGRFEFKNGINDERLPLGISK